MQRQEFNSGWKFFLVGEEDKAKTVTLPHDAMLHSNRSATSPGNHAGGFYEGGVYVYEKSFQAPLEWRDQSVYVEFGGIYRNATIYLNGEKMTFWPYGYTTYAVCLDTALRYGEQNLLRVEADNSKLPNTRWYSGGGIYRKVSLLLGGKSHIGVNGVRVTTKELHPPVISVDTKVIGDGDVLVDILDSNQRIASATGKHVEISMPEALLWDVNHPKLYQCRVTLSDGERILDTAEESFGLRQITWSTQGLFLNGQETLLKGACIHHDNGILGACSYYEAEERRIRILKEQGFNAIRMAHHPAGRELLEACDRLGMLVCDEAFDMWYEHKNLYDYASDFGAWHEKDLRAMVEKDYNHPSVILYSIGNEVSEPRDVRGQQVAAEMIDFLHALDGTRPVTAGINLMLMYFSSKGMGVFNEEEAKTKLDSAECYDQNLNGNAAAKATGSLFFNQMIQKFGAGTSKISRLKAVDRVTSPVLDMLDIAGYNYASGRYPLEKQQHPNRIVVGSETYPYEIAKNWKMVKQYPYVIGDFMWTGWDYLGEAALGTWNYEGVAMGNVRYPWLLAEAGAIDITGYPGAEAAYAKTVWEELVKPYIGVRPCNHPKEKLSIGMWRGTNAIDCWSWHGCEGNKVVVEVYSAAPTVALFLNGKRIGKKKTKDYKALFHTTYQPGSLVAVAYDKSGSELERHCLRSAKEELHIQIIPESEAKEGKLLYVDIQVADAFGTVEANADRILGIEVQNAEVLGFGSATPAPVKPFVTGYTETYFGRAQAILRPLRAGELTITITDEYNQTRTSQKLVVASI